MKKYPNNKEHAPPPGYWVGAGSPSPAQAPDGSRIGIYDYREDAVADCWMIFLRDKPDRLETKVRSCARCGLDHTVEFQKFRVAPDTGHTHWGTCPTTNEPILLRVEDTQ